MIATSAEHRALLADWKREFWAVDLYQFTFLDGTTLRYSGHALSTNWNGYTWQGGGPIFSRGQTKLIRGLEVDSLTIDITPRDTDLLLGIPFGVAVQNGALDGVTVTVYRGHSATPGGDLAGAFMRFKGEVSTIDGAHPITLTVKSSLVRLDAQIPRDLWQPGCSRTLYDAGCGVSRAAYQFNGSTEAGSDNVKIVATLPQDGDYYTGGQVRFISGQNAGARRSIRVGSGNALFLSYPLLHSVGAGDSFQLWPGCAHTWGECKAKFNNGSAFNGQPFVPSPETAL